MSGHWSEKARNEARMFGKVTEVAVDPEGLYFEIPDGKTWEMDREGAYFHYTSADTCQGLEIRNFDFDAVPEGMPVCCDASANLGSHPVDVSKYGVLYAASHKNFSTSGICYTIIRRDLISDQTDESHAHHVQLADLPECPQQNLQCTCLAVCLVGRSQHGVDD